MKRILIILFLLISGKIVLCQSSPISIKGFESVEDYFEKQYYDPMRRIIYPYTIDTLCESGCSFLSFVINRTGEISNIRFNSSTPPVVKDLFRRICQESNSKWIIDTSIKHNEITVIIPFYYNFYRAEVGVCATKRNNCESDFLTMMSTFQNSEQNTRTKIERIKKPQNVWLYSPLFFQTIVFFHSNSKYTGQ